jgi:T4 RnlA family RNA ligase
MQIYNENKKIKSFVIDSLKAGLTPLFEYVAFDNRVVLKYAGKDLRLIGVRNNETGKYTSAADMSVHITYGIRTVNTVVKTIEQLEEMMKTAEGIEGVVVEFEDGQLVKWKTQWYFNLHGIRTENIFREDYIIKNYLEETLDDVTQELDMKTDEDAFKFIEIVKTAVNNWSNYIEENVDNLVSEYETPFYKGQWAKFATDKHKSKFFGLARRKIENCEDYYQYKIKYMLESANHLMQAKNIVEKFKK